jgi:hypothetical protein
MPGAWSSSPELVSPGGPVACCHRGLSSASQSQHRVVLAAEFCAATADELRVIEITPHDYRRMAELLTPYSSLRHQLARQVRWLFGSRL